MANNNLLTLTELTEKLPLGIQGWKKCTEGTVYNPENLFEYINGAAELYISYSFKYLAARTYTKEGFPEIKIDIFDMGNSLNAFGVFSHSRESVDRFVAPGVESEYASGLLTFWKGRYYISILAYPETEEKKSIVKKLARHISGLIREESRKPPIIALLPSEDLVPQSIRYFRHYIWLNSHYFISDKNILHINKGTEAVLAKYNFDRKGETTSLLLLVTYPDPAKAKTAYESFLKNYLHLHDAQEGFKQLEDHRWTGCKYDGKLVSIVFNAPGLEQAKTLLTRVKK